MAIEERPTAHQAATDPIGTVRIHPDDQLDDPAARRFIKAAHGGWIALTSPHPVQPEAPAEEVAATWPRQPLSHLAQLLGHHDGHASPWPRHTTARSEHLRRPHTVSRCTRAVPTAPPPTKPTFWEEAKVFCRARNTAFALACQWLDDYLAASEEPRTRPDGS